MSKLVRVSDMTHQRLCDIGKKNESFNTIIERLLERNEEYLEIKELIEADKSLETEDYEEFESAEELINYIKRE